MPVPRTCPMCGGPASAALYRPLKNAPLLADTTDPRTSPPKKFVSIGRAYCAPCDYLIPREPRGYDGHGDTPRRASS